MSKWIRVILAAALLSAVLIPANLAWANDDNCIEGVQASGAVYRICMPAVWNGDLVVYAHGYVESSNPIAIPEDQLFLDDGTSLIELINSLGYAFAVTSYSKNGLAVLQGVADVVDLVDIFKGLHPETDEVIISGPSEGGLVTTLAVERHPEIFAGGLAVCGPVGDFQKQVNYLGDFRIVFDYFFPGLLPPSPIDIPQEVMDNWETVYLPTILAAAMADPVATAQLLTVTGAPVNPADPATIAATLENVLWYNIFATNDAKATLFGQPFNNMRRIYLGSQDDLALNLGVQRFAADPLAKAEIGKYQTTGRLSVPLVNMHTTGDPIVPFWHSVLYSQKAFRNSALGLYLVLPINRYGHCAFTAKEVLIGFGALVALIERNDTAQAQGIALPSGEDQILYLPVTHH